MEFEDLDANMYNLVTNRKLFMKLITAKRYQDYIASETKEQKTSKKRKKKAYRLQDLSNRLRNRLDSSVFSSSNTRNRMSTYSKSSAANDSGFESHMNK